MSETLNPLLLAFMAGLFTWVMTSAGAALVFLFKEINKNILNIMLGFAAGVMVAASFWSLLLPATEIAKEENMVEWMPVIIGFAAGGAFLILMDKVLPHLHPNSKDGSPEGMPSNLRKSILLVFAITLHNIPEGFAVGVAFGAMANEGVTFAAAIVVALGIGIQNLPEGAAVSIPLRKEGYSRRKSFMIGQLSGAVEPVAALLGAYFAMNMAYLLPYTLSFAAGAMIYVVVEELIPESQSEEHSHGATIGSMSGFLLMTFLDIALG
ncbi:ZIP family metal transporter [Mucispirillum schaedleri]|uniref:ZIP family metal transporter n=1 Tax=Mucispirillum schaedleri TaxID=248039 RepID=UPI001F5603BE|nr:ZIP family metal transporter [Mucispirillum schaedleri]